jgi:hypothetical protein
LLLHRVADEHLVFEAVFLDFEVVAGLAIKPEALGQTEARKVSP